MIRPLIEDHLLRAVRREIQDSLSFAPKETDIYKIHQSGDLANLEGLDDASLSRLPSLLKLRNALYSSEFREYLSTITGSGPLSGKRTDMAINVYTPGCHLLCHDDVIGSRRLSYILYLTDPDRPWRESWGGALRLYPTNIVTDETGKKLKTPSPDFSVSIPPAFNQLSFFAVQPGESFHDVEEVYARQPGEGGEDVDGGRVRMAISGWYHIPQEGEEGFVEGLEEQLGEKSSLVQLQGKATELDLPQLQVRDYDRETADGKGKGKAVMLSDDTGDDLSEDDLNFLLKFMSPTYLTPDTVEDLSGLFAEDSSIRLESFLSSKFADELRNYIERSEQDPLPPSTAEIEQTSLWRVARPPHKHRFLFQQQGERENPQGEDRTPLQQLLNEFLPSQAFKKWLVLATGVKLKSYNVLARRFRRGHDYTLATSHEEGLRVEVTLNITPTPGWGEDDDEQEKEEEQAEETGPSEASNGTPHVKSTANGEGVGGYEMYMAGEDDDDDDDEEQKAKDGKKTKADPAVYKASGGEAGEDDGVLFSMSAGWNRMSIVLRDQGVLKFVKYVSRAARGDRWDLVGEFGVFEEDLTEDEGEGD